MMYHPAPATSAFFRNFLRELLSAFIPTNLGRPDQLSRASAIYFFPARLWRTAPLAFPVPQGVPDLFPIRGGEFATDVKYDASTLPAHGHAYKVFLTVRPVATQHPEIVLAVTGRHQLFKMILFQRLLQFAPFFPRFW